MRNIRVLLIAALCAITSLFSSGLLADKLIMSNGDVITGSISKIVDDKVHIDPSYADEFSVNLSEVASIESDRLFDIELANGKTFEAALAGGEDGQQTLMVNGESKTINMMDFAEATEPEAWYDRTSHVDVNLTWNEGNTVSRNNLVFADTNLKLGDHRHLGDITIRRDSTDGIDTVKQDLLNYSYNWIFNKPWYSGVTASFERDPIKQLDRRYKLGLIIGRDMIDDANTFLTWNVGAGWSEEKYFNNAESGATGLWELRYEQDLRDGDFAFFHNNSIDYQFYGENNAIIKTNTGFRFDIVTDIYTSLSLRYDYETQPPIGNKNEDVTLAIGVGAKF